MKNVVTKHISILCQPQKFVEKAIDLYVKNKNHFIRLILKINNIFEYNIYIIITR